MPKKYEGRTTYVVAGNGYWGRGEDLDQAKRNFTREGGRLSGGYQVIHFGEGSLFAGVDAMGRYYWHGPPPEVTDVAPRRRS